jgi:hypothetical protein
LLQFSPVLHTSMLYWAAYFKNIEPKLMIRIMQETEAYPEGPVKIEQWRSPCHAAALVGDRDKLKILMVELNKRYSKETDTTSAQGGSTKTSFSAGSTILAEYERIKN